MTTRTDFTEAATRNPQAKQDTRQRSLDLVRRATHLWSPDHQALRYDWVELAGHHAPTFQLLLDEQAFAGAPVQPAKAPARFIGVDTEAQVLAACQDHYEGCPAAWVQGNLLTLLQDRTAFENTGVLIYDSFQAVRGRTGIERALPILGRFARRQEDRLGDFLMVLNVVNRWIDTPAAVDRYRALVAAEFGVEPDLHCYTSKRMPMLWTGVRLGF